MPNIIDFLEKLGQDAELRQATSAQLEEELKRIGLDAQARAIVLGPDRRSLEDLLGADSNVCCMVVPAKEDEEEEEQESEDDEEEEEGDEENHSTSYSVARRSAA